MCVLLDSNIWLAIVTCDGASRALWRRLHDQGTVIASEWVYDEVSAKLVGRFEFSPQHAVTMTRFVRRQTVSVGFPQLPRAVCRDPDDDNILAAAVAGSCEFLITGDHDLLVLGEFDGVKIVKLRAFVDTQDASVR